MKCFVPDTGGQLPIYHVSAVAEALGMTEKQLDNILSRNDVAGVERRTRGVSRRVSVDAAITIHLAFDLAASLRIPVVHALSLAESLQTAADYSLPAGRFARIRADVAALRAETLTRLDAAVEAVGRRRRGRPPRASSEARILQGRN
jgi:hypothetical protein